MKKQLLLLAITMATTALSAQTILWDGEDETITSRNDYGGWWDRGNPMVVDNPETDGINTSAKCLKFTMTGNNFGEKHVALPFRDWITPDLQGNRRFSLMIKKAANDNVKIEISDPTNGADGYWEKTAAWYGSEGKWQKVVFDFSTNTNMNDFPGVISIEAQTGNVSEPQDVYIDNIVIEPMPTIDGTPLKDIADGSLTGSVKVTGSLMKGDCQNANGEWFRVDYDDFALLKDKLSAEVTELDMRGVILKDAYWDQILDKCPSITIRLDDETITSISQLDRIVNTEHQTYYTLTGARIDKPLTKGVYILRTDYSGAKKVVVK